MSLYFLGKENFFLKFIFSAALFVLRTCRFYKAISAVSHEMKQILTIQPVKLGVVFCFVLSGEEEQEGRICSVHAQQSWLRAVFLCILLTTLAATVNFISGFFGIIMNLIQFLTLISAYPSQAPRKLRMRTCAHMSRAGYNRVIWIILSYFMYSMFILASSGHHACFWQFPLLHHVTSATVS